MQNFEHHSLKAVSVVTFLNYAGRGMTLPFISIYLVSVGFTGTEIGIVLSVSALVRLVLPPFLNTLADKRGRHRHLYYGLVIGNIIATLSLILSPAKLWLSSVVVVRDSLDGPSASLLSQLTITQLQSEKRDIYGRMRAFGSLGWAVTSMLSGTFIGIGGYTLLFIISAILNLISLPFARLLPTATNTESSRKNDALNPAKRQLGFYILMTSWFLFYVGMSALAAFMFVYFQQELGATDTMIGVLASVAALAEIPSMIIIDALLRKVNLRSTLIVGVLGMAGTWVAASVLQDTTLLIPLMIIRGTFYTFQTVGITLLVSRISHPTNVATNQALLQVTIPALAILVTGPIAGWIYDVMGARILFQVASLVSVLAVVLLIAARRQLARTPTHDYQANV